ncbi:Yip1 domain protein [Aspergillus thermomutatus]|uniref:Yip1 domain-containing protein n=1 Tax=Aspergillus thermomutatus TaxID=41047 RepID=A0A397G4F8_ASPTH|nr:uncharacterized protein CDV56_102313 [Aspergillus thermomutatus]RHZ44959.1 hypothetical protein CDV56_102313 [Aspergillus thermomutatus]
MASTSQSRFHEDLQDDESILDDDLIDADDGEYVSFSGSSLDFIRFLFVYPSYYDVLMLRDLSTMTAIEADDPLHTSDTAPLRGNIQSEPSSSSRGGFGNNLSSNYLTSTIPGEDRRAAQNTIDETVWETLSRDLQAVWEKMRQVLWPKYLMGGMLQRGGGGIGAAERGEATGFGGGLRGIVGRWPDADVVLQGGMSEGLRDWDLWGPLIFCLLLSMFLSMRAKDEQSSLVFSGVFSIVWIGEAVVTLQIKLLGGNISFFQSVCIIGYTLFPLVIAAMLSALGLPTIARIPVYLALIAWSLAAGVSILGGSGVIKNRLEDWRIDTAGQISYQSNCERNFSTEYTVQHEMNGKGDRNTTFGHVSGVEPSGDWATRRSDNETTQHSSASLFSELDCVSICGFTTLLYQRTSLCPSSERFEPKPLCFEAPAVGYRNVFAGRFRHNNPTTQVDSTGPARFINDFQPASALITA